MMSHNHGNGLPIRLMAILMMLACVIAAVFAMPVYSAYGSEDNGSIFGSYSAEGKTLSGVKLDVYKVASWDAKDGTWKPVAPFDRYQVSWNINGADAEQLRGLAGTLRAYAIRDHITVTRTTSSGKDGVFSIDRLTDGLYLMTGARWSGDGLSCGISESLIVLPDTNGARNLSVTPKTQCQPSSQQPTSLQVQKNWKTDGSVLTSHPASVDMQLLRDGSIVDTVTLSASNGWQHEWTGLDPASDWTVTEKDIPQGYTVYSSQDGNLITVVNTGRTPPHTGVNVTVVFSVVVGLLAVAIILIAYRARRCAAVTECD